MAQLVQLPDVVDISFVAGDTFRIRVRVIDPNTGDPLVINPDSDDPTDKPDVANEYAFCAQIIKVNDPSRAVVAEFVITADPDALDSAVILTLSPSETAILPGMGDGNVFNGLWDLEVVFPSLDVRTVATGKVTCYIDVSKCPPADLGP